MSNPAFEVIGFTGTAVRLLDQRELPRREITVDYFSGAELAVAIREMVVRGAPAIGISAAYGVALDAARAAREPIGFDDAVARSIEVLAASRPTAVNLFWALRRMQGVFAGSASVSPAERAALLLAEARSIHAEDAAVCARIGEHGARALPGSRSLLTHCNTGALATGGIGTALGIARVLHGEGRLAALWVDETRPFLQGARLTAWEAMKEGMPATLIADVAAGLLMRRGEVDAVIVGADRVARNGDAANKIGTYSLAVLARHHGIPFFVAAPLSTVDLETPTGDGIVIEERSPKEVTELWGQVVAPQGMRAYNPAFDVTPGELISGIVTEVGVARTPFEVSLAAMFR